jgi:hypothetical protein
MQPEGITPISGGSLPQSHDGALAVVLFNLGKRGLERAFFFFIHANGSESQTFFIGALLGWAAHVFLVRMMGVPLHWILRRLWAGCFPGSGPIGNQYALLCTKEQVKLWLIKND